ncbi:MAG TPA: twin-arginine translocation signal domain-containing protein [Gemmataceae bacterium]|nr:twin-arginine translocation signal domain-containing protein [Gemmataceae bacterium]
MKKNPTRRAALGTVGAAGLAALAATALLPSNASAADYPKLHHALDALRDAREELKNADYTFKGHKAKAIDSINDAIDQVKVCIDSL